MKTVKTKNAICVGKYIEDYIHLKIIYWNAISKIVNTFPAVLLFLSGNFLRMLTLLETLFDVKLRTVADTTFAGSRHDLNCFSCREQILFSISIQVREK